MSMRLGSAMPALHVVCQRWETGSQWREQRRRGGGGGMGGPGMLSDGGLREPSDGGPQTPLMGSRGHLGAASEVFDFCPGLSFPPLACLEGHSVNDIYEHI